MGATMSFCAAPEVLATSKRRHISDMFLRSAVALAILGYASAFGCVGPMQLKPSASLPLITSSRAALRAEGPSMKIGVFYGT